jgi:hypothetical protein
VLLLFLTCWRTRRSLSLTLLLLTISPRSLPLLYVLYLLFLDLNNLTNTNMQSVEIARAVDFSIRMPGNSPYDSLRTSLIARRSHVSAANILS